MPEREGQAVQREFEPSNEDIRKIREWLKKTPHLVQDYDDQFLAAFIRSRKGSLQKAKERLERFNSLGMQFPEICGSLDPLNPRLQDLLSVFLIFPLSTKTDDSGFVLYIRKHPDSKDSSKAHISEIFRYILMSAYVLLWENSFGSGICNVICDARNANLADVMDVTPTTAKQMVTVAESGIPLRIQSANILNLHPALKFIVNMFKFLTKTKLGDRISCMSCSDDLQKRFPREILPKEYGGFGENIFLLHENWKKKIESYRERFLKEEQKMRNLDPLRPKTCDEEMTGTFRQLNVD